MATIKNEKQIDFYFKKNSKFYLSGGGIMSSLGAADVENNRISIIFPSANPVKTNIDSVLLKEITENIAKAAKKIHLGDDVYVVNLFVEGTTFDFYVFVNPKTKVVLDEGNFLAFSIPLYYADFHSKATLSEVKPGKI